MSGDLQTENWDVVVVGAGPAGMAAAAECAVAGLSVILLDEQPSLGGQIYRAVTRSSVRPLTILGAEYWEGARLVKEVERSGAVISMGTTVWAIDEERLVYTKSIAGVRVLRPKIVILATGAMERPFPISGWTLPGVMTVGAAQIMLKSSGAIAGGEVVLAGTGPLLWLYAAQMLRAGGRIKAILDTGMPVSAWRGGWADLVPFLLSPYFRKGVGLLREVISRVCVERGVLDLEAQGDELLGRVVFRTRKGKQAMLDCDTLLLHQGIVPNTNLAMSMGVAHRWHEAQLCWVPTLEDGGRTSVPGVFLAGDGAGIVGAEGAEETGRRVAAAVTGEFKVLQGKPRRIRARTEHGRRFLDMVFRPQDQFRLPVGDDLVCRCEEVTAGQVRELAATVISGPNQAKALLRCGMGPCQGRLCGLTVTELIARERGISPQEAGHYRVRSPVKPVTVAELASVPHTDSEVGKVVRIA